MLASEYQWQPRSISTVHPKQVVHACAASCSILLCIQAATCIAMSLQDFLEAKGTKAEDGRREDPPLAAFEEQIQKYK